MTNAIALCGAEPQSIVTTRGSGRGKSSASPDRVNESFKKKLEAFGAMAAPVQAQPDCGNTDWNAGMQDGAEGLTAVSAAACSIEGVELPATPQAAAGLQNAADGAVLQAGAFAEAQAGTAAETAEGIGEAAGQNAWTQTAKAGERPAMTQDQILESVGDYLDGALGLQEEPSEAQRNPVVRTEAPSAPPVPEDTEEPVQDAAKAEPKDMPDLAGTQETAPAEAFAAGGETEAVKGDSSPLALSGKEEAEPQDTKEADAGNHLNAASAQSAAEVQDVREPSASARAAKPAGTPEAERPYAKENVLRIVDSVSIKSAEGKHEFEVELKPEFLGKVRIRLTMEKGSMHMQIHAEDPAVRQMLSDHAESLMGALREKGIALSGMDVSRDSHAALDGQGQQPSGRNGSGRQGGMRAAFAQAETRTEQIWDAFSLYAGNSTVEFFA